MVQSSIDSESVQLEINTVCCNLGQYIAKKLTFTTKMEDTTSFPLASLNQESESKKNMYMSSGNQRTRGRRTKKRPYLQHDREIETAVTENIDRRRGLRRRSSLGMSCRSITLVRSREECFFPRFRGQRAADALVRTPQQRLRFVACFWMHGMAEWGEHPRTIY